MIDNHVHTNFSYDSKLSPHDAIKNAILLGLEGIAITDHLDYDYPGYENDFIISFIDYMNALERMDSLSGSKLKIIKGVEVGFQPHVLEKNFSVVKSNAFDFVIGSVHIIDRQDPYNGEFYQDKPLKAAYTRYLAEVLDMVKKFYNFDILGHIDYIARYSRYDDRTLYYRDYTDVLDEIFKTIIHRGQGIEINTRTYYHQNKYGVCTLDKQLLGRYKELGGEIITLGSDAHSVDDIGREFKKYVEIIRNAGFKYTASYSARKPCFRAL